MPKNQQSLAKKQKAATVPIMYRFPAEDIAFIDALCSKSGHTRSSFTRFVMRQYVSNQKMISSVAE